jgi:hypothetical protein
MRLQLSILKAIALCYLVNSIFCQNHEQKISNRSIKNLHAVGLRDQAFPQNHRVNPEEVPKLSFEATQNQSDQTIKELPFNVDFVEKPDQFEASQSFFMPTRRMPSMLYKPVSLDNISSSRGEDQRWSVTYDETNKNSNNDRNQIRASHHGYDDGLRASAAGTTEQTNGPSSVAVEFDDDGSENKYLITTMSPNGSQVIVMNDTVTLANSGVDGAARLRKQVENELNKSLDEQSKLIKLLAQRIDRSRLVEKIGHPANQVGSGFVSFKGSKNFMKGQVPANHVVRHPKYSRDPSHPSSGSLLLNPNHITRGSVSSPGWSHSTGGFVPLNVVAPSVAFDSSTASGLFNATRQFLDEDADLKQVSRLISESRQIPKSLVNFYEEPTRDEQSSRAHKKTYSQNFDYAPNRHKMIMSNGPRHHGEVRRPVGKLEPEENDDESQYSGIRPRPVNWPDILDDNDDESDTTDKQRFGEGDQLDSQSPSNYELYHHPVFTSSVLDHRPGADRGRRRKINPMNFQRPMVMGPPRHHRHYAATSAIESRNPLHHQHQALGERQFYELSHAIIPSDSHKVIHIHSKEKKGHGKYLWPILGGGLVMLMGFLIISNMLLSIPLLAMGASSLFSQGGIHTQQLVPVYNLSQLARPSTGRRRRRRWISAQRRLDEKRDEFDFDTLLRRVMARFAISNKCKAI